MTKVEINKLAQVVQQLVKNTEVLHPTAAQLLYNDICNPTDSNVLDILLGHLDNIYIYEVYNRFDLQSCRKEIKLLQEVINKKSESEGCEE